MPALLEYPLALGYASVYGFAIHQIGASLIAYDQINRAVDDPDARAGLPERLDDGWLARVYPPRPHSAPDENEHAGDDGDQPHDEGHFMEAERKHGD